MIAIIAILAAMLLPALGKARDRAEVVFCANNLRQLAIASNLYCDDYDEYFAPVYDTVSGTTYWCEFLAPYAGSPVVVGNLARTGEVWRCPTAAKVVPSYGAYGRLNGSATQALNVPLASARFTNYSWNGYLGIRYTATNPGYSYRRTQIQRHSETVMVMDAIFYNGAFADNSTGAVIVAQNSNAWYHRNRNLNERYKYFHGGITPVGETLNAAFVDGNVRSFRAPQIKSGWFKIGSSWKDAEISGNSPEGP